MAQKYTDNSSVSSTPRQFNSGLAAVQLSDGTLVFISYDGNTSVYSLKWTADRSIVNTISTLTTFTASGFVTNMGLCVDASDNIYVFSSDASSSSWDLRVQAFTKGVGHSWTTQTAIISTVGGNGQINGVQGLWCNTGGGTGNHGHLMLIGGDVNGDSKYWIVDAGICLAGSGTMVVNGGNLPTFASNSYGYVMDISADSPGASSGVAVFNYTNVLTAFNVGRWSISSAGVLTTSTNIVSNSSLGASNSDRMRLMRYDVAKWVLITQSTVLAGRYAAWLVTPSTVGPAVNSGAPTNMPLVSTTSTSHIPSWDAYIDPLVANRAWVIAPTQSTAGTVYRVSVDLGSGTPVWAGAATLDDTFTGIISTPTGVRACWNPNTLVVDYQISVQLTGSYTLYGNYNGTIALKSTGSSAPQGKRSNGNSAIHGHRGRGVLTTF